MNRKNRVWTLAALLGLLAFVLTFGVSLAAYPAFYVKIENKTTNAVKIKWKFTTRAGKDLNPSEAKITTIAPHTTQRFSGSPGEGQMHVWINTGSEGGVIKKYSFNGDMNPQALNAHFYIQYNKDGYLRIFKPNG